MNPYGIPFMWPNGNNFGITGGMPNNMNMNMNMMGMQEDEEWMKGFKMGVDEVNNPGGNFDDSNYNGPKINIVFTTTTGQSRNLKFKNGTTLSQAIKRYLQSVGKEELFGHNDQVNFLFNANKIDFNDNTPIEKKFVNILLPKIIVNDTKHLIGA